MSIRVKGWIAAVALVAFVGLPLAASAGQAAPPAAAAQQAASASGELVKVDATAKTLTIKADGRDQEFTFNDQTKITGAQNAAGLATINKTGTTQLRVYFNLDDNDDTGNDYIGYYSGEATSANRPQLVVTYQ